MATFPLLRTGAVAQYPLGFGVRFTTQAVRFLDGSQQKYRLSGKGLRRWTVQLDQLDEQELCAFMTFAEQQGSDPFPFTDPLTGTTVPRCRLYGLEFEVRMTRDLRGQTTVEIEEIA